MAGKSVAMETECLALKDLTCPGNTKENIFHPLVERRKIQLKSDATAAMVMRPQSSETTPTKQAIRVHEEPWSPTANLKVLIQAASLDIRDREMREALFQPIKNKCEALDYPSQRELTGEGADDIEKRPCRKQKSLGLLCQKFLALYPDYPASSEGMSIPLDEVAVSLGVERRRLYDIVNVLESLKLVSRVAKNRYLWHGRQRLLQTLHELCDVRPGQPYPQQAGGSGHAQSVEAPVQTVDGAEQDSDADASFGLTVGRKDRSLRSMSKKFITLFLVSETQTVTLDLAARVLIDESQDPGSRSKYKTKVRRLYDIANVLTSLGLIEKIQIKDTRGRKPAFKWTGPAENRAEISSGCLHAVDLHSQNIAASHDDCHLGVSGGRKQRVARHDSCCVTPGPADPLLGDSSAPCSPPCDRTSPIPQPVDYSRKGVSQQQLQDGQRIQNSEEPGVLTVKDKPQSHTHNHSPTGVPEAPCRPFPLTSFYPTIVQAHPQVTSMCPSFTSAKAHPPSCFPQASVILLYGGKIPNTREIEGVGSSLIEPSKSILGKRKIEDEEGAVVKRNQLAIQEEEPFPKCSSEQVEMCSDVDRCHPQMSPKLDSQILGARSLTPPKDGEANTHSVPVPHPSSPYLCFPISGGIHSLNLLLSSGHVPMPNGGVPALALPCVLLPSSALASHPTITDCSCATPAAVAPCGFVGSRPLAISGAPAALSSPEQPHAQVSAPPSSPVGLQLPQIRMTTPPTLKQAVPGNAQAFFETPGTLGTGRQPATRWRGLAQRRLDVEHKAAN